MPINRLIAFFLFLLPFEAWSNYNPEKIKEDMTQQQEQFLINGWKKSNDGRTWFASTGLKLASLSIGENRAELVQPYVNAKQIRSANERCLTMGMIGLSPNTAKERESISSVVKLAAHKHVPKRTEVNNVRFEVTPKVVGSFVRLFCVVEPAI